MQKELARRLTRKIKHSLAFDELDDVVGLVLDLDSSNHSSISDNVGGVLTTWLSSPKLSNNFTQTVGASQPNVNTSTINGKNVVSLDGGDFLNGGQPASLDFTPTTDEFTIFVVTDINTSSDGTIIGKAGSTTTQRQYQIYSQTNLLKTIVGGANIIESSGAPTGSAKILELEVTTSQAQLFIDGAADTSGVISNNTNSADVLIGARRNDDVNGGQAFQLAGLIGRVLIYNKILTASKKRAVRQYLSNEWGVSV